MVVITLSPLANQNEVGLFQSAISFNLLSGRKHSITQTHVWPWTTKPVIRVFYWDLYIINKLSIDVWFVMIDNIWLRCNYLKIWNPRVQTNLNIDKISFKVVQIKFLAMHITNQKLSVYSWKFTKYLHKTWYLLNIQKIFGIEEKSCNVFLAIATNIPQRLKTGFVLQDHILFEWKFQFCDWCFNYPK